MHCTPNLKNKSSKDNNQLDFCSHTYVHIINDWAFETPTIRIYGSGLYISQKLNYNGAATSLKVTRKFQVSSYVLFCM